MRFVPLESCSPGELFRPTWAGSPLCILMTDHEERRRLAVILTGDDDGQHPYYRPCDQDEGLVAAFGHDYEIEIDPNGPIDLLRSNLWDVNGAIHVVNERWLLRVSPAGGLLEWGARYFDLLDFRIAQGPQTGSAIFAKWSLRLRLRADDPPRVLFQFGFREVE